MSTVTVNTTATRNQNITFLTIDQLKAHYKVSEIGIIRNPNTGKIFADMVGIGIRLKVEQNIDFQQPIRFLVENGLMDEGCIVNVKADNTITVL